VSVVLHVAGARRPAGAPVPSGPLRPESPPNRARAAGTAVAVTLALLVVLLAGLVVGGGRPAPAPVGLPDAGPLTGWGLPVVRLALRVTALAAVGSLLFAAALAPAPGGRLTGSARRAVAGASRWALAWAGATVAGGLLTLSNLYGVPVSALTPSSVVPFVTDLAPGRATGLVLALTLALAAGRRCSTRRAAGVLLVLALAAVVLPAVLAGHSAAAGDHLVAVASLAVHVGSATLWVGGLLALLVYGRDRGLLARAAGRYSAVALACFVATGASGLLSAWVLVGGRTHALGDTAATLASGYGALLLLKVAAFAALGAFGWWHRRSTLRRLAAGHPGAFRRFAGVEVVVLLATVATAVALSASPPPSASSAGGPAAASSTSSTSPAAAPAAAPAVGPDAPPSPAADAPLPSQDMSGHDHGELSVGVLVDDTRFHVSAPVTTGQSVTVYNTSTTDVTITAADGTFDTLVRGQTFVTFPAPDRPGSYRFSSRHSAAFADVLVVRAP
jgi:putative copper resistance protein D